MGAGAGPGRHALPRAAPRGHARAGTGPLQRRVLHPEGRVAGAERAQPARGAGGVGGRGYPPEARALLEKEGPKYQYGTGCLSDGVLGRLDGRGVRRAACPSTRARSLATSRPCTATTSARTSATHANPQRPTYACGDEGGLLLCTWPRGGKPSAALRLQRRGVDRHRVPGRLAPDDGGPRRAGAGDRARVPGALRRPRAQPVRRIRMRPLVRAGDGVLRDAPGAHRRALRRGRGTRTCSQDPGGFPRVPRHRHRLRHGGGARRQAVPGGE